MMNDAHLHLLINHFPIIGMIIGIGIHITGIALKNNSLKNTAYVLYIISAISGFLAMQSGEKAEEFTENLQGFSEDFMHRHEELAETFALVLYITAAMALGSIIAQIKKYRFAALLSYITLAIAIFATVLAKGVGTSGGEIRHTEIRSDNATNATAIPAETEEE